MALVVETLGVTLARRRVIDGVSFTAAPGELVVLVGPNGSGKTTLVRALCGLIPHEGRALWNGMALAAMAPARRATTLAYLPQGHLAHWPIPARDVVAIGRAPTASSLARLPPRDRARIDMALEEMEALAFADRPVTQLSGGERARVMLARALAIDAPLMLADEPIASLDPAHQLAVMAILKRLAHAGRLVIAVIHDLLLAARFADRVLVLDEGRLLADGAPAATLTPQLLAKVFAVDTVGLQADGHVLQVPWRARPGAG